MNTCAMNGLVPDVRFARVMMFMIIVTIVLYFCRARPCLEVAKLGGVSDEERAAVSAWIDAFDLKRRSKEPVVADHLQYAISLIERHIRDIPGWENVNPKRYKGIVIIVDDKDEARALQFKHHDALTRFNGWHVSGQNISYVLRCLCGDHETTTETLIHEQLHSYCTDEAMVTFATYWLMLHYGTFAEQLHAWSCIRTHAANPPSSHYGCCIHYFYKAITEGRAK